VVTELKQGGMSWWCQETRASAGLARVFEHSMNLTPYTRPVPEECWHSAHKTHVVHVFRSVGVFMEDEFWDTCVQWFCSPHNLTVWQQQPQPNSTLVPCHAPTPIPFPKPFWLNMEGCSEVCLAARKPKICPLRFPLPTPHRHPCPGIIVNQGLSQLPCLT
jgi:hypothetical protein